MSEQENTEEVLVKSSRFGEFKVPKSSLIEFPSGMIGFSGDKSFVIVEHKPPFSWMHSVSNPDLAFVVVDGLEFGETFQVKLPYGDPDIDLKEGDECAILIVVTVRPDPKLTTANLKAPVFVNLRNRKGVQVVLDDARLSTRFTLWTEEIGPEEAKAPANEGKTDPKKEPGK